MKDVDTKPGFAVHYSQSVRLAYAFAVAIIIYIFSFLSSLAKSIIYNITYMQCRDLTFHGIQKQKSAISVDCINVIMQNFSYTYIFIILFSSEAICIVMYA